MPTASSQAATERIWTNYRAELLRFIARRVGSEDAARDILQTVFVRIHGSGPAIDRSERRLSAWLYRVTRNAIIDHYRTRRAFQPLPPDLPAPREAGTDRAIDLACCIGPMLRDLPGIYRAAVTMADLEQMPLQAVALRLGLSLPAVKSRVQRGRRMLLQRFLDCCHFEVDARGKPIAWTTRTAQCGQTSGC